MKNKILHETQTLIIGLFFLAQYHGFIFPDIPTAQAISGLLALVCSELIGRLIVQFAPKKWIKP